MANIVKTVRLTRREREICELICQGKSNKEIARALEITYRTVDSHRMGINRKMGVNNPAALVHKMLSARIAELEAARGAN